MSRRCFVLLSGKRKSGKDYLAEKLKSDLQALGITVGLVRLSEPLKREFARIHNLDYQELLSSSQYKEKFRSEMVQWGEDIRRKDEGYFCGLALDQCPEGKSAQICIVVDCRRPSDINYFMKYQSDQKIFVIKIRIESDEISRKNRYWKFVSGIDDAETECGLDRESDWDMIVINNDSNREEFQSIFNELKYKLYNLFKV